MQNTIYLARLYLKDVVIDENEHDIWWLKVNSIVEIQYFKYADYSNICNSAKRQLRQQFIQRSQRFFFDSS